MTLLSLGLTFSSVSDRLAEDPEGDQWQLPDQTSHRWCRRAADHGVHPGLPWQGVKEPGGRDHRQRGQVQAGAQDRAAERRHPETGERANKHHLSITGTQTHTHTVQQYRLHPPVSAHTHALSTPTYIKAQALQVKTDRMSGRPSAWHACLLTERRSLWLRAHDPH